MAYAVVKLSTVSKSRILLNSIIAISYGSTHKLPTISSNSTQLSITRSRHPPEEEGFLQAFYCLRIHSTGVVFISCDWGKEFKGPVMVSSKYLCFIVQITQIKEKLTDT